MQNTKTILEISGMHCASCAQKIENALKKIDGVKEVNVNFAWKKRSLNTQRVCRIKASLLM